MDGTGFKLSFALADTTSRFVAADIGKKRSTLDLIWLQHKVITKLGLFIWEIYLNRAFLSQARVDLKQIDNNFYVIFTLLAYPAQINQE